MKFRSLVGASSLVLIALLTGCTTAGSSLSYNPSQMQQLQYVEFGKVYSVQAVKMTGQPNGLITLGSTTLGGMAGQNIGKGSGAVAGAIVGAMIGGLVSEAAQKNLSKDALEITVQLDNGKFISIVQTAEVSFIPGQRVRVLTGLGVARVAPM